MRIRLLDFVVILSIIALFLPSYYAIYPLHTPSNGHFMIESIPSYFWVLYTVLLLIHLVLLTGRGFCISRPLLTALTYTLLYLCSLRTFASLHFTGFMGSDSPNFVGLTQYWITRDHVDLAKISYGDNPGLFILSKIVVLITSLDVNTYTIVMGIIWMTTVYLIFRIATFQYIVSSETDQQVRRDHGEPIITMVPLIATLSYFALAIPFSVNFQYAPQTFTLILLLVFFFLLRLSLTKFEGFQTLIPVIAIYTAIQISHPFMFMFGISTTALLISARWLTRSRFLQDDPLRARGRRLVKLFLTMIMLSSAYIVYQTTLLRRRVGEVVRSILEAFELKFPIEYFEQLSTPAFPHYEPSYYLIAVIHSITWIIIAMIIAILVLKILVSKVPKYYEFSIIAGSLVALVTFMSTFTLQEFVVRAGQVLLFGSLLLATKSMMIRNDKFQVASSRLLISLLLVLLTMSSFLAFIRYTWYAQPPHLSPNDVTISRILEEFVDLTKYYASRSKLLMWNSLNAYHNSRLYGSYPMSYSPIMLTSLHITTQDLIEYDILWSNMLKLEIIKYIGRPPGMEEIAHSNSVVFNARYAVLIIRTTQQ